MSSVKRPWVALAVAAVVIGAVVVAVVAVTGEDDEPPPASAAESASTSESVSASDPAVVELQRVMTQLGYYTGPIDGVYGDATTAAVKEMQSALGIEADGVFGPSTSAALEAKGEQIVVQIQTELAKYGYYTGPLDGNYGSETADAVERLQADLGVTADGKFGPETLAAFEQAVADGTLEPVDTTTTDTTDGATTTTDTTDGATTTTDTTDGATTTSP
jgi:peptidoglycan hydrolase-like protein with peptidoglycan-binding domain